MNRVMIALAALAAATGMSAKEKPKSPAPPPKTYENDDIKMGPAIDEACAASPMAVDTYDGLDNMLIVETTNGGHAFLHLSGCDFNTLLFAEQISPPAGGCFKKGDSITVTDSGGGARQCAVTGINEWHPEKSEIPDDQDSNN